MDELLDSGTGTLRIRETYNPVGRTMFIVMAVLIAGLGVIGGYGVTDLYSSGESVYKVVVAALVTVLAFVVSFVLLRLHLELRIDRKRVAARAWPFPWTVVPIDQVLASEVVQIDPLWDYGGWGLKGIAQDRLIGGTGTTAVRITYTHESGEQRKLTFLTERAEEANQRIASQRTR